MPKTSTKVTKPNFVDKTIWTGDNLDILRGLNSETVDLIYLDPPFNSNRNYEAPVGSKAAGAAFKDAWTLSDLDVAWMGLIADEQPAVANLLHTASLTHGKGMQSYLTMMAVRLFEMRRVLKPTGSIYLHCDPTASHYLKLLMDSVYGSQNFRSEVIWKRSAAHSDTRQGRRQYGRIHDVLLFYTKSAQWTWNPIYTDYDPEYVKKFYRHVESGTNRKYRLDNLTGPGGAAKGNPQFEVLGVTRYWRYSRSRMQELLDAGRVVQTKDGTVPSYKRYLDEMPGVPLQDSWTDVSPLQSKSKERVGYPTQKPLKLLERIIATSSNEGDTVLDPFAGCATACVAAEKLGRQWIGIDLSPVAYTLVQERLAREVQVGSKESPPPNGLECHAQKRHSTPYGRRCAQELPAAQARPVRAAGRPVQRVSNGLPVQDIHDRPYSSSITWRGRQHRKPSTSLRSLQQHQGQQTPGIPDIQIEGNTQGDDVCHDLRRNAAVRSKNLTRPILMPHRSNWRKLSSVRRRTRRNVLCQPTGARSTAVRSTTLRRCTTMAVAKDAMPPRP